METTTQQRFKIDSHAHIMPESWPDLKEKFGYTGFIKPVKDSEKELVHLYKDDGTFFRTVKPNCYSPEAILPEMDAYNVDKMVLCTIPVLFNYWAKPEDTYEWSVFLNDHILSVQKHPSNRFIALGTLPMQSPTLAVKELERIKKLGIPGVQIGSNINNINLDDPQFYPIWEAAEHLQVSVFVHPWQMMGEENIGKYWLPWLVGMPAETARAICSMMFGGIFDRYPKLKVMFAHAGGAFPFTLGRISHGWHCRPDLVNLNSVKDPYSYPGSFWVDGITHNTDAFQYLLKVMGEDKVCYGTDYPFPLGDLEHGKFIEEMSNLSEKTKSKIMRTNLLDFLSLPY
jgi:aminocarboxymuconate-semialdehyde decarboxylase